MSQKLILALTVAVGLGVVGIGYYFWGSSTPAVVEVAKETPRDSSSQTEHTKEPLTPSQFPTPEVKTESSLIVEKSHEKGQAPLVQACSASFIFLLSQEGNDPKSYSQLDDAIEKLRTSSPKTTLTLGFDQCAIKSIDRKIFRRFLARLGDYIFVQRMLHYKDLGEVLRNPDFMRVSADDLEKRGNIMLAEIKDTEHLAVDIRGLAHQVDQVKVVAEILVKAIENPEKIIDQPELEVKRLVEHFKEHKGEKVAEIHEDFIEDLEESIIYKDTFLPDVKSNWQGFLPNVDFRKLPQITESQLNSLNRHYGQFFDDIELNIIKKIETNKEYDDDEYLTLLKTHHDWLVYRLKLWAKETDLSSIMISALLHQ